MAPRQPGARRNQSQNEHVYELGKQGRKTGITIRDTGARDEHGMQPLEHLFSSPEKTATMAIDMNGSRTPARSAQQNGDDDYSGDDSSGEDMDIENTTAPDPARLLMPLPRARSPVKTYLQSPAHKNPHLGPSSSPTRGTIVEQRARDEAVQSAKRRLDFSMSRAAARELLTGNSPGKRGAPPRTRGRNDSSHEDDDDDEAILQGQDDTNLPDDSMAMVDVGGDADSDALLNDDTGDVELGEGSRNGDSHQARGGNMRRRTRSSGGVNGSILNDDTEEAEKQPSKPSPALKKKRGRPPAKRPTTDQSDQDKDEDDELPRRAVKRARTNNAGDAAEPAEPAEPEPAPQPKKAVGRPRGGKAGIGRKTATSAPEEASASSRPQQNNKAKSGGKGAAVARPRRSESPPAEGADASLAVVPRGPPLPKSRGLLINRRIETPGSGNIQQTRSGRNSFRPLAFWKNEHVDYDQDATVDDAFTRGTNRKIVLPTIKEIVRVEEEEAPATKKNRTTAKSKASANSKAKRKRDGHEAELLYDSEPADPWEDQPGNVVGDAIVWRPEYDETPPSMDEDVDMVPQQLAISAQAIQTREIRNASFRFAKTLNTSFFGAGVVDLPPGSEKRPKNSRKMYMAFFVFAGKVLVTVNETTFRISRGGMWFVPRGNTYSIENDYDETARIFFSQGCEPLQLPVGVEEEAAE